MQLRRPSGRFSSDFDVSAASPLAELRRTEVGVQRAPAKEQPKPIETGRYLASYLAGMMCLDPELTAERIEKLPVAKAGELEQAANTFILTGSEKAHEHLLDLYLQLQKT